LVGDFNMILDARKKRGKVYIRDPYKEIVEDLISNSKLLDVKPNKQINLV
jgi:hypothetical protein